jgi:hypothetical protein
MGEAFEAPAFGVFPFGRANTLRPARLAIAKPHALVVGVYPSAWHIEWIAPRYLQGEGRTGSVKALAVDVEPTVFWAGEADSFTSRLDQWRSAVSFVEGDEPGQHGHIVPRSPSTNGSSGRKVRDYYLSPLGIDEASVSFTDICPVFFVKFAGRRSATGRRQQGDAVSQEYNAIARQMSLPESTIPARPSAAKLPALVATQFADRLMADLRTAVADLVITLGEEVWATLLLLSELEPRSPVKTFRDLYGPRYGSTGSLVLAGRTVTWLPLVHPGLLSGADPQAVDDIEPRRRTIAGWNTLHASWRRSGRR